MKLLTSMAMLSRFLILSSVVSFARGADNATPEEVVVPSENASSEALKLSSREGALRLAGLDFFPHAASTALYDDNLLISHTNRLGVNELTLSPGLTVVAGDVANAFPGSVTLAQLRGLLDNSLLADASKPQRFIGIDDTRDLNLFVDHNHFNNVDDYAGLIAGYAFSSLTIGLDQDFKREAVKDNVIGDRVTIREYDTHIRSRYELTDRTSVEVNGRYQRVEYEDEVFQGYQEFRNDDWFNRNFGDKLSVGLGAGFGFVFPEANASQTYQQALGRAAYKVSGKISLVAEAGVEVREYSQGRGETIHPALNVVGLYQPRATTTFSLHAYEREEPSPSADVNYTTYGTSVGARQQLFSRIYADVNAGYNEVNFASPGASAETARTDSFFFARLRLDYELNTHWTASLFYTYNQNDSTSSKFSYDNNIFGTRVSWRF